MEHQKQHKYTPGQRCAGGAIAVAVLAGLVALPATSATAAAAAAQTTAVAQSTERSTSAALAVTHGLQFAPGDRVGLTGTAAPDAEVTIAGLPGKNGAIDKPATVLADHTGKWVVATSAGSARADSYDLTVTSGGTSIDVTTKADPDYHLVERELTVPAGQRFVAGERPVVSGTADAYSIVIVRGLPGTPSSDAVGAIADENGDWSIRAAQPASGAIVVDVTGQSLGQSKTVQEHVELEARAGEFEAFTIEDGLTYAPGTRLALSGEALPGSAIKVEGLPTNPGVPNLGPTQRIVADAFGKWKLFTPGKSATADGYDITFTVAGSTRVERVTADEAYAPVQRDFTVAEGQTFVVGEIATVTGTADAFSTVRVDGLPGRTGIYGVEADRHGNWTATSAVPATAAFTVQASGFEHGGFSEVVKRTIQPEQTQTAPITVATTSFVKGQKQLIEGTAAPKARVDIYSGSKYLMNVTADGAGKWSYTTGAVINDDTFTRILKSDGAEDLEFTLTAAEQEQKAPITVVTTSFVKGQKQLIEGTAAPKARVDIYSGSKYLMNVTADAAGKWSYTTGAVINDDTFTRTLKSDGAKDLTFTLTAAEQEQKAPITVDTTTFVKGQKQLIEGTAEPKAKVNIYSGSKYLMNVTANAEGKWSYTTGAVITDDRFTRTLKSEGAKDLTFTLNAQ
ncbi:hypothetical protein [Curtobacterium sp. GD1]|uniref:hypothetical protein n=1 Tax=Curtobacterium sp. GD1 TaxID=2810612 RepID=UPI001E4A5B23|nr:hypothetical protein [Curtobacterium sp. GD1]MCC8907780.1 hypothetical protein [Curtobacterium sp. GD1]